MFLRSLVVSALVLVGCGDDGGSTVAPDTTVETAGMYPVGTALFTLTDATRSRALPAQLWYPAATGTVVTGFPIEELEDAPNRATYAGLLAAADPACPTRTALAARDAAPASGRFPIIAFSHCHECTRWSAETIAERLASHGFVVLADDHTGNTLWNNQAGDGLPLDGTTLALRVGDVRFALDQVLAEAPPVPPAVAAAVDADHVGMMGHSFGAVTAGKVAQDDDRIDAALALAAPMENPLLPGVMVASLDVPLGFMLAREDNSITEIGNGFIRTNYDKAAAGAWKIEIADAGHWSVSDVVGAIPGFAPGCKAGTRQSDGTAFTYLDAATGRGIAASYATAFFEAYLQDNAGARAYLTSLRPDGVITADRK
jgi:dienelactone hydrolase